MLNKIVLGTANFTSPYGVLNNGTAIGSKTVAQIFAYAHAQGMNMADTAFAYGNLYSLLKDLEFLSDLKFVSKFSLMDDHTQIYSQIRNILDAYSIPIFYGLLVHDPANLDKIDRKRTVEFLHGLKSEGIVTKVGISVYELEDVEKFSSILIPDLIQVPVNPLNQIFINDDFISFVEKNDIEVHARSLFLQGILLAAELPKKLSPLTEIWNRFNTIAGYSSSRLNTLLSWANSQTWIDKWVLGVTSVEDIQNIVAQISAMSNEQPIDIFQEFKHLNNPLIDPRNWSRV